MSEVILSMLFERRSSSIDHFVLQLDRKKSSVSAWIGHRDLLRRLQGQLAARETVRVEQESGQDGVTAPFCGRVMHVFCLQFREEQLW